MWKGLVSRFRRKEIDYFSDHLIDRYVKNIYQELVSVTSWVSKQAIKNMRNVDVSPSSVNTSDCLYESMS